MTAKWMCSCSTRCKYKFLKQKQPGMIAGKLMSTFCRNIETFCRNIRNFQLCLHQVLQAKFIYCEKVFVWLQVSSCQSLLSLSLSLSPSLSLSVLFQNDRRFHSDILGYLQSFSAKSVNCFYPLTGFTKKGSS